MSHSDSSSSSSSSSSSTSTTTNTRKRHYQPNPRQTIYIDNADAIAIITAAENNKRQEKRQEKKQKRLSRKDDNKTEEKKKKPLMKVKKEVKEKHDGEEKKVKKERKKASSTKPTKTKWYVQGPYGDVLYDDVKEYWWLIVAKTQKEAEDIAMTHLAHDWGEASTPESLEAFKQRRNKAYQSNDEFGSSSLYQEDLQDSIDNMKVMKGRSMLKEVFEPMPIDSVPKEVLDKILVKESGISTYYAIFDADFDERDDMKQQRWSIRAGSLKEAKALMDWYVTEHQLELDGLVILKSKDALAKLFTPINDDNHDNHE